MYVDSNSCRAVDFLANVTNKLLIIGFVPKTNEEMVQIIGRVDRSVADKPKSILLSPSSMEFEDPKSLQNWYKLKASSMKNDETIRSFILTSYHEQILKFKTEKEADKFLEIIQERKPLEFNDW